VNLSPKYQVGDEVYWAYIPNADGEVISEYSGKILSIAHNNAGLHPLEATGKEYNWIMSSQGSTWFYFIEVDQEEIKELGLEPLIFSDGSVMTTEVIVEGMITREKLSF
jgi:hypothetical protein